MLLCVVNAHLPECRGHKLALPCPHSMVSQALQQQLYQQWPLMQRHNHVVVHVPSLHRSGKKGGLSSGQVCA